MNQATNQIKIEVDKCNEFYNRPIKSLLQDNDVQMKSTHNKGKSVVAERLFVTLKYQNL